MPSMAATSAAVQRPGAAEARTSVKSRGSMPFWTVRERMALAMLLLRRSGCPRRSPRAVRSSWSASLPTTRLRAARRSSGMLPPRKSSAISRPRTRLASVTVGSVAALAIGGRARIGAGALRADAEGAAAVDIGDRAAAGADGVDVDHRQQHREAGDRWSLRASVSVNAPSWTMPMSALVPPISKVISLLASACRPIQAPPSTPAARPDSSVSGRPLGDQRRRRDAAIRRHDVQFGIDAEPAQLACEVGDVVAHLRADEGRHRRGGEPFELAKLRRDVRRRGDEGVRQFLARDVGGAALMGRIDVGEQEADDDRTRCRPRSVRCAARRTPSSSSGSQLRAVRRPSGRRPSCGGAASPSAGSARAGPA